MKHTIEILSIFLILFFFSCEAYKEEKEYAKTLIQKVEQYEKENGKLPEDVSDFGLTFKMDSPAFYIKTTDTTYIVYYAIAGVGNSMVYYSETKEWKEEG